MGAWHLQRGQLREHFRRAKLPKLEVLEVENGYRLNQEMGYKSQSATLFLIPEEIRKKIKLPHVEYSDFSYLQSLQKGMSEKEGDLDFVG